MKAGRGKAKGNSFELKVCKALSNWITRGEQLDLFARNVISGGSFTSHKKGLPGDIMSNAIHPQGAEFLRSFSIECKHRASLQLERFLFDAGEGSFLWTTFRQCEKQAQTMKAWPMVVAKQNMRDTLMLVDWMIAERAIVAQRKRITLRYHKLHSGRVGMFEFDNFVMAVDPDQFMAQMKGKA